LATLAMAVGIGHGGFLGLSFIWMMPVSLLTGIIVGCLASALPLGERRPMLELGESPATATSDVAP
jgi:hypothetical protein